MSKPQAGLRDKLYWRQKAGGLNLYHAFEKVGPCRWESLCGDHRIAGRIGGQDTRRPAPIARCATCDIAEMKLRGWEESGPTEYTPAVTA